MNTLQDMTPPFASVLGVNTAGHEARYRPVRFSYFPEWFFGEEGMHGSVFVNRTLDPAQTPHMYGFKVVALPARTSTMPNVADRRGPASCM